jgi:hypothetical protein
MQVQNKKKTRRRHNRSTQKILSYNTLTKMAHKPDQTSAPRHKSPRIIARAHMSASQRKAELGRLHMGSTEPLGRPNPDGLPSRCILTWSTPYVSSMPWLRFPYIKMTGTALGGYKRRPRPPSFTHTTHWKPLSLAHFVTCTP